MTQEILTESNKPIDQNDLNTVENIVYSIFSKSNERNKLYWKKIRSLFLQAMKNADLNYLKRNIFWLYVNFNIRKALKENKPLVVVEDEFRNFLKKPARQDIDKEVIEIKRAKLNLENMKDYLKGEKILDLGAGDGRLAQEINDQLSKKVILVDIVDYNKSELPLILYEHGDQIPLADREVDTTILYTVLHHSTNPEYLLKEATRVTKNCLVIKEAYVDKEEFRMSNSFFDWFYNRVIGNEDINVPLNFLKLEGWEKILSSLGFEVIKTEYVGLDEPLVPEYHVFIIAERIGN